MDPLQAGGSTSRTIMEWTLDGFSPATSKTHRGSSDCQC